MDSSSVLRLSEGAEELQTAFNNWLTSFERFPVSSPSLRALFRRVVFFSGLLCGVARRFSVKGKLILPKVSVVMPVCNGERFLPAALDSLLFQSYENFELIVVDNGSTDGTSEVLKGYAPVLKGGLRF